MKIAILHDKISRQAPKDELDSLIQTKAVSNALSELGHKPVLMPLPIDMTLVQEGLTTISPDIVFNLIESINGHGQLIFFVPACLDRLRIPYSGSPTEALLLSSNKLMAKQILKASGISTPLWYTLEDLNHLPSIEKGEYIIKSIWEHASIGLDKDSVVPISLKEQLKDEIKKRKDGWGKAFFAESFITGREFNISLLEGEKGLQPLPPAEIIFHKYPAKNRQIVDYTAKWDEASFEYSHTVRSFDFPKEDIPLLQKLTKMAKACWEILGLRGYARIDFRVDYTQRPWVIDVNANPCLAPDSGFIASAQQAGLDYNQVIQKIVETR